MLWWKRLFASLFLLGVLILIDHVTKWTALQYLPQEKVFCNTSGPWGIPIPQSLLIGLSACILIGMIGIEWKERAYRNAWILILAGGTSNLLERIFRRCVVDFLDIPLIPFFNIADVFITGGCFFLVYLLVVDKYIERKNIY